MKTLEKVVLVNASIADAWEAWTTENGLKSFMTPNVKMRLEKNGPMEILFDMSQPEGLRGSEGCVVLDWSQERSFEFSWNFPPSLPSIREERTTVTVTFTPLDGGPGTEVVLRQTGWGSGGDWDAGYAYFDRAWGMVMTNFASTMDG